VTKEGSRALPGEAAPGLARLAALVESRLGMVLSGRNPVDLWRVVLAMAASERRDPLELLGSLVRDGLSESAVPAFAELITVGETYFFREPRTLETFQELVLAPFARGSGPGRLRIWCAGCSTGEEPYTLSMMASRALGGAAGREVSILGTDVNHGFLERARRGIYRAWSFRGVDPADMDLFFERTPEGDGAVRPLYRRGVSFSHLNLADDRWRLWGDGLPPDVIFCRNVLIYFAPERIVEAVRRFHAMLPLGGWLVLAPCESYTVLSSLFTPVFREGSTIYRKDAPCERGAMEETRPFHGVILEEGAEEPLGSDLLDSWTGIEMELDGANLPPDEYTPPPAEEAGAVSLEECLRVARELADRGRHSEALEWAERAVKIDGRAAEPRCLLGLIASELGDEESAASSLRRALYLDPGLAMAHYALGGLALRRGRKDEARRHFRNAEELLSRRLNGDLAAEELLLAARSMRSLCEQG